MVFLGMTLEIPEDSENWGTDLAVVTKHLTLPGLNQVFQDTAQHIMKHFEETSRHWTSRVTANGQA